MERETELARIFVVRQYRNQALHDLWEKRDLLPNGQELESKRAVLEEFVKLETDSLGGALFEAGFITACDEILKLCLSIEK